MQVYPTPHKFTVKFQREEGDDLDIASVTFPTLPPNGTITATVPPGNGRRPQVQARSNDLDQ